MGITASGYKKLQALLSNDFRTSKHVEKFTTSELQKNEIRYMYRDFDVIITSYNLIGVRLNCIHPKLELDIKNYNKIYKNSEPYYEPWKPNIAKYLGTRIFFNYIMRKVVIADLYIDDTSKYPMMNIRFGNENTMLDFKSHPFYNIDIPYIYKPVFEDIKKEYKKLNYKKRYIDRSC